MCVIKFQAEIPGDSAFASDWSTHAPCLQLHVLTLQKKKKKKLTPGLLAVALFGGLPKGAAERQSKDIISIHDPSLNEDTEQF